MQESSCSAELLEPGDLARKLRYVDAIPRIVIAVQDSSIRDDWCAIWSTDTSKFAIVTSAKRTELIAHWRLVRDAVC